MAYKDLFSFAAELGKELSELYRNNKSGRADVLEFMESNCWFGVEYVMENSAPLMCSRDLEALREPLTLWLSAYRRSGREKLLLMLEHFGGVYPETCRLYRKFISDRQLHDEPSAWKLLDYLLSEIDRDITEYSEAKIEALIHRMDSGATRVASKMFAEFLDEASLTRFTYSFNIRAVPETINEAYSLEDFAVMAYCVFNESAWEKQELIRKALSSKAYAEQWLFVALHFVCALRRGDMKRLPAPSLNYDSETIMNKIANGEFSMQQASALTSDLTIRLKLKPMKPSKTSEHEKVPELKLFVPESLRAPLGIIMAIALAHRPETKAGDCFVQSSDSLSNVRSFFGEHFVKALGGRCFSSRRANKSYLQGIEAASNDTPGKPKGYMLAALARSHKSGISTLSETTDIYLRDAKFNGYSPEFIMRQMFERGVFSFIPAVLLEIYAGNEYTRLPVGAQTQLIGEVGIAAHKIEWLAETVDCAMIKCRNTVNTTLANASDIKKNVFDTLQNIASGNAPSRQRECLCLMTAAGFPCAFSCRGSCIGCGYEIYTKTAMYTLMQEYSRIMRTKNRSETSEARRYEKILEQAILPAAAEMLAAAKLLYPEADVTELLDIMEKGLDQLDCDTGTNKRELQPRTLGSGD